VDFDVTDALGEIVARPGEGAVGSEVVLRGRGFAARASEDLVELAGTPVPVSSATSSELHLRVPDARSGPFVVRVGAARAQTRDPFIVTHPPHIRAVSSETIPAGQPFEVRGDGFGESVALLRVTLGDRPLPVISLGDEWIVVRAPREALTGQLSVRVALQGGAVFARPLHVMAVPPPTPITRAAR
jgi:hypothetical protein